LLDYRRTLAIAEPAKARNIPAATRLMVFAMLIPRL